jgi:hypothetical protein
MQRFTSTSSDLDGYQWELLAGGPPWGRIAEAQTGHGDWAVTIEPLDQLLRVTDIEFVC